MCYYAGISDINARTAKLPRGIMEFFRHSLPKPLGLYFKCGAPGTFTTESAITVTPVVMGDILCGATVSLGGLELRLLLHLPTEAQLSELIYRPPMIGFIDQDRLHTLALAYAEPGTSSLWISRTPPGPKLPTGIFTASGRTEIQP